MSNVRPTHQHVRLAIAYKNFAFQKGVSHIGLGISSLQNAKALRLAGYIVEVWAVKDAADLAARLAADRALAVHAHHVPITHVVIAALWIPTAELAELTAQYSDTEFVIVSHSNVGFLQVDPGAIRLLREGAELAHAFPNFHIGGNTSKFRTWWTSTYQSAMQLLANMYPFQHIRHKPAWRGGTLRIGCFGAVRPQKNVLTAAAAALEVGTRLRPDSLEFWISAGRAEGNPGTIERAIREMYAGVPRTKVVENHWQSWPQFLHTVGSMDLLLQPSYTESFNMVTADGVSRGVATVIGDSIPWAPRSWVAATDSASDIANRAIALLHDPNAVDEGADALIEHNSHALAHWKEFLRLHP